MGPFHRQREGSKPRTSRPGAGRRKERRSEPGVEGLESRQLLSITEFTSLPTNSGPTGIASGDGSLWVAEGSTGQIARIDPGNPGAAPVSIAASPGAKPYDVVVDPHGRVWFTDEGLGAVGVYNPSNQTVTEYELPGSAGSGASHDANATPVGITVGPDGNIWFTEQRDNLIGVINPNTAPESGGVLPLSSGVVTVYSTGTGTNPTEIVSAGGKLWVSELGDNGSHNNRVGAFDPGNPGLGVKQYALTNTADLQGLGIALGSDGNVWVALHNSAYSQGTLVSFDPSNPASQSQVAEANGILGLYLTPGGDGNLYVTLKGNQVGTIDLRASGPDRRIQPFSTNNPTSVTNEITAGPDGNIWFTDKGLIGSTKGGVGVFPITQLVVSMPSSITADSPFSVTVKDQYLYGPGAGTIDAQYNGDVTLRLDPTPSSTGGNFTVQAVNGVANFTGLTIGQAGSYVILANAGVAGSAQTSQFSVSPSPTPTSPSPTPTSPTPTPTSPGSTPTSTPSPTPTIVAEQIKAVFLKHNRKGKAMGKPVEEIVLTFSTAMNAGSIGNAGAYQVAWASTRRVKRKLVTTLHPVGVPSATPGATNTTVTLVTSGMASKFARGGRLTISPGSIVNADGVSLGAPTVFLIAPRARGISPSS